MQHELFRIHIDDLRDSELHKLLLSFLRSKKTYCIATPNPEMLVDARESARFTKRLQATDMNLPDGVALRFAIAALTDKYLKYRHTGVDTLHTLIELCAKEKKRMLFFGTTQEILDAAIENLEGVVDVRGIDPGIVRIEGGRVVLEEGILEKVKELKPAVIAIALPHKKQLAFMRQFKGQLPNVRIMIGVGGAVDMISGKLKRAPRWMRQAGLEWIWRVLIEPKRLGRIAKSSIYFPFFVLLEAFRQKRFFKACWRTIPEILKQLIGK